jgi:hypothetical protein
MCKDTQLKRVNPVTSCSLQDYNTASAAMKLFKAIACIRYEHIHRWVAVGGGGRIRY